MSNPYEDWKKQYKKDIYACNKCKHEMGIFDIDGKQQSMDQIMGMLGQTAQSKPAAFYCKNKRCERFGLLTKVAITK